MLSSRPEPAPPTADHAQLVIETMYQVAADPEGWEQLIEVLGEGGLGREPDADFVRGLAISEDIARLTRDADELPAGGRPDLGWMLLTARGKVSAHNPAARMVMEDGLGVLEIGREIGFDNPDNQEALAEALARTRKARQGQVILKLERGDEAGPSFAYVIPARTLPAVVGVGLVIPEEDETYAVVFPAAAETGVLWTSIRESFGLTAAEARLARKLRDGRTLQEAAEVLSVSVNTVRNQLRAVFDKMGLKRQSDLIRALTELSSLASTIDMQTPIRQPVEEAPPVRAITLSDGRKLAYREYGDPRGKALLSFHEGLGSSLLPPDTDALARRLGLRIVCADRPGFGQSDIRGDYSFDGVAQDMVELCDQLGLDEVRVAGVLSGALCAIATGIRLGPRAVKVMVCSGRSPRPPEGGNPLVQFRRRMEDNPWVLETLFSILRLRISPAMLERILRRQGSPGDLAYLDAHPEAATYVAAYVAEALARTGRGPADEVRAFRRARNMDLAGLRAPLIVWHGEQDRLAPAASMLVFAGDRASEVRVTPEIGHFLALKHWEEILTGAAA